MTLAKEPNDFPLNCDLLVPRNSFWQSAVFLLTSLTVPIIVIFEYPSPVRALEALLTQLGRLEIPITES